MKVIGDYKEWVEKNTGKKFTKIELSSIYDAFEGENLKQAEKWFTNCERGNCHFNAGMTMRVFQPTEGYYEITFCEGLATNYMIPHCWNKVKNLLTGEVFYVDFTLGATGDAYLIEEWDEDIVKLFDAVRFSFIPFKNGYVETRGNKKAERIFHWHYPNFGKTA